MANLDGGRILVVEPRRVAARALAGWVAQQRGTTLGAQVGYQVRFEGRHGPDTRIVFVTPGVALSMLAAPADGGEPDALRRFDAVLVDEFHERAWEVDLIVTLVRLGRSRAQGKRLGLVVCSATLAEAALAAELEARIVRSEGRSFAVDITYRGDGAPTDADLDLRVAQATREALQHDDGDVLVFLPGKAEIGRCLRALSECGAELVAVHGGLPPGPLAAALSHRSRGGQRRVFLATNVAETSLTIPGVRTVIDTGLVRMAVHQAGRSLLALVAISQASADQRAGRAGRVAAGRCVRLWSEHYAAVAETPPELLRVELDDVVLRAAAAGLSGEGFASAPWVTEPPTFALASARQRLQQAGALDAAGHLTDSGRTRAALPVSAWAGRILADAPPLHAGLIADTVALAELGRDLVLPADHRSDDEARAKLWAGSTDELEVQLRALWHGHASRHGLHSRALLEARDLSNQLRRRIGAKPRRPGDAITLDRRALVAHLLQRVPESAFVPRRERAGSDRGDHRGRGTAWGNGQVEVTLRPPAIPAVGPDQQPPVPAAAVVLDLFWLGVGRRARGHGRLVLACRPADLLAAGIGESEIGPPILLRERGRRTVVADVELRHAATVLLRERVPLSGDALVDALGRLIVEGRFKRLDHAAILHGLHVHAMLLQLLPESGDPPAPITAQAHVTQRLRSLGVTCVDDLSLVEVDDLIPDLNGEAVRLGIDAREPAALAKDFPRTWSFQGTLFACTVDLRRKSVRLEPIKSSGKGREPPANVLPRFRGFSVHYRRVSREIRLR